MLKKILFTTLIVVFLTAGTVSAQGRGLPGAGILPGNPFYIFEIISEGIGTLFTFGDVAKAERFLALAGERLSEAEALAEKGESNRAEKATEKYEKRLAKALVKAEKAKEKGKDTDAVLEKIAEATVRHQAVLAKVYDKVPEHLLPKKSEHLLPKKSFSCRMARQNGIFYFPQSAPFFS